MTSMPWPCPTHGLQQPHNVHFTKEGSLELAKEVARHIRKALSIQPDTMPVQLGIWAPGNLPAADSKLAVRKGWFNFNR